MTTNDMLILIESRKLWVHEMLTRDYCFELQVQEHGIGDCTIKRKDDQDESDERNQSNRVGGHAYQNRIEEQRNSKPA